MFVCFAALVPLEELREVNFTKQYGIPKDPELIDILEAGSKTNGVYAYRFLFCLFTIISSFFLNGDFICLLWVEGLP